MTKILFYYASPIEISNRVFLGTSILYLKTYIERYNHSLSDSLEWLLPQQVELTDNELIKLCQGTDILCTSHYIWNDKTILDQLARIKPHINPSIKIVVGGPAISVNIDPEYFQKYPFIDYAVYGPGEQAFNDLIDSIVNNKKLHSINTSNIAWQDGTKQVIAKYQYVSMLQDSPFIHNQELFTRMVNQEYQHNRHVAVPYELTRGCPYACTFCDWNSGFGNKTTRRKGTFKDDIDLFYNLKVYDIYLSDANVGQYDEDIDIIKYFADKNINHGAKFNLLGNYSKLKKVNNLKIYHQLAQGNLVKQGFTMSCQDIDPTILKNIDRPDITWPEHVKIIDELQEYYPTIPSKIQLIQGLPGQTVESWRTTLSEISKKPLLLQVFMNELLATSPAARNPDYQQRFNFVYSNSLRYGSRKNEGVYFKGQFPQSCVSFTQRDFVKMSLLSHIYSVICTTKFAFKKYYDSFDTESIVNNFINSSYAIELENNLYNNWLEDKFYYTITFGGNEKIISACSAAEVVEEWTISKEYHKFILTQLTNKDLKKEYLLAIDEHRLNNVVQEY